MGHRTKRGDATREIILEFVRKYRDQQGYPPSLLEISQAVGTVKSNVVMHLRTLRADGRVTWQEHKSRTLRVVK